MKQNLLQLAQNTPGTVNPNGYHTWTLHIASHLGNTWRCTRCNFIYPSGSTSLLIKPCIHQVDDQGHFCRDRIRSQLIEEVMES